MTTEELVRGKTLREVATTLRGEIPDFIHGVAVFLKGGDDPDHAPGRQVAEAYSMAALVRRNPVLADAVVVNYNTYMGQSVYRVTCPGYAPGKKE